jgi:hypothetical protein
MRNRKPLQWSLALTLTTVAAFTGGSQEAPIEVANMPLAGAPAAKSNSLAQATDELFRADTDVGPEIDLTNAAFQPISTERPLPSDIQPSASVAEVIRLAEAGVEPGVLLAFITNSSGPFNLKAGDIIYLNDLGVPAVAMTAMIQRDQVLKGISPTNSSGDVAAGLPDPATSKFAPAAFVPAPIPPVDEQAVPSAPASPDYTSVDSPAPPEEDSAPPSFYNSLAPYGTWVNVAGYGPCWQPTVVVANPYWQPYLNCGRWVYTDCGWYWRSGYSWGWAPFHYGRWFRHSHLGWCWAPGRTWAPSWVCWRYSGSYCGWAPLPPGARYQAGVGLSYWGRPVGSSFGFGLGPRSYAFVPFGHFWDQHLQQHTVPNHQAGQVFHQTVASASIGNSRHGVANHGIPPSRVAAATHQVVQQVPVHQAHGASARGFGASPRVPAPLILHGPSRSTPPAGGNRPNASHETRTPDARVVAGRRELAPAPGAPQGPGVSAQTPRSQNAVPAQTASPVTPMNQRPGPNSGANFDARRIPRATWQVPTTARVERRNPDQDQLVSEARPAAPAAVEVQPRTFAISRMPSTFRAPAMESSRSYSTSRAQPAPAPTIAPARTYAAPAVTYAPRPQAMGSRPVSSAPAVPATSASGGSFRSSPPRNGR